MILWHELRGMPSRMVASPPEAIDGPLWLEGEAEARACVDAARLSVSDDLEAESSPFVELSARERAR
jgi:hypothetical protein